MNLFGTLALIGWPVVVVALFALLPPRRALVISFMGAWLFLPVGGWALEGLPDYTKSTATTMAAFAAAMVFDSRRILALRPKWIDLPMLGWMAASFASAVANGFGVYGGISMMMGPLFEWALPWVLGRAYFSDREGLAELARGFFAGAVLYVPLILFENRMSPQLNGWIYGQMRGTWRNIGTFGFLGWQPTVFMQNALALTLFMASASLIGFWLWRTRAARTVFGWPISWCVPAVMVATVLCKSLGSNLIMVMGVTGLYLSSRLKRKVLLLALLMGAPTYMALRANGLWSGRDLVDFVAKFATEERQASLAGRLDNEDLLIAHAQQRPWLGWSGWGRSLIWNEWGGQVTVADGFWIIALGTTGIVGLASVTLALLLPALRMIWRHPAAALGHPALAPAAALAVAIGMYQIDCLFNAMLHPLFPLMAGGLAGLAIAGNAPRALRHRGGGTWRQRPLAARPPAQAGLRPAVAAGESAR